MQAPKNNLQEVLRRKHESAALASPATTLSSSTKKFKPAPTASAPASRIAILSTLPSFSTPGFRRAQLVSKRDDATPRSREVVSISSDSTASSPPPKIKRTSSDPLVASDPSPQPSKRLKRNALAEKENYFEPASNVKSKGKSKEVLLHNARMEQSASDDEEPWLQMDLDAERNPFTKLDRDYPSFAAQSPAAFPSLPAQDQDLLQKDLETLKALLVENYELVGIITEKELEHHRGSSKKTDIVMLQRLSSTLNNRVTSVKTVIAFRENNASAIQRTALKPPLQVTECMTTTPPLQSSLASTSRLTRDISVSSIVDSRTCQVSSISARDTRVHVDDVRTKATTVYNDDEDDDPMPASEVDYWASMDDVPIDGSFAEDRHSGPAQAISTSAIPHGDLTAGPYYQEISRKLAVFGLKKFRLNQLEAITEALNGRDVFVLMPTGGGKSLCYQLPAICQSGKTNGVTVVVSPLLALMKDQVHSLMEKSIDVFLWNSEATYDEATNRLRATRKPSLVYITPEKLKDNNAAKRLLGELYHNNALARFVIDEAHCISTWGQDFRDAYRDLGTLRSQFPNVPIMALTATARKVTVDDIKERLHLRNCAFFSQSFNRPNLSYFVKPKAKKWMESMMEFISSKYPNESGVIYCLGRDKCEEVAKKLNENGFSAKHFHAGMSQVDKDQTLDEWRKDKVHIIVATIAFGMGIDKADVRFVIHYSLPKSLDGYYQETGRAGRDGKPADCILYFLYKDFLALRNMIERPDNNNVLPSKESIERQTAAVRAVLDFCLNISECRRAQLLHYFDEKFDKAQCARGCDNCDHPDPLVTRDATKEARDAVQLVENFQRRSDLVTLAQCRDILRGANTAFMRNKNYDKEPLFGSARDLTSEFAEQIFRTLCQMDVLVEHSIQQASGYHSEYLKLGPRAQQFQRNEEEVLIGWRPKPGKTSGKSAKKQLATKPPSAKRATKGKYKAIETDPIELYEDDSPYETSERPESDPSSLYKEMCNLRDRVMLREHISDPEEVFGDTTLQYLSAICPDDYKSFISSTTDDIMDDKEATARFNKFGVEFLDLCIRYKLGSDAAQVTGLDVGDLRSRYQYPSSATPTSSRKSKFKPHR